MKNLLILAAVACACNAQLLGGFNAASTCLNINPIGSPVNLYASQINELQAFLNNGHDNQLTLIFLSTQVVAGLNYRAVFNMTSNGETQWVGIQAFRSLQGILSISKYIQTNDWSDIATPFQLTGTEPTSLVALDCGNLLSQYNNPTSSSNTTTTPGSGSQSNSTQTGNGAEESKHDDNRESLISRRRRHVPRKGLLNKNRRALVPGWKKDKNWKRANRGDDIHLEISGHDEDSEYRLIVAGNPHSESDWDDFDGNWHGRRTRRGRGNRRFGRRFRRGDISEHDLDPNDLAYRTWNYRGIPAKRVSADRK